MIVSVVLSSGPDCLTVLLAKRLMNSGIAFILSLLSNIFIAVNFVIIFKIYFEIGFILRV